MSSVLPFIEREINGTLYKCSTLKLAQWAELTEVLAKFTGEPFASIVGSEQSGNYEKDKESDFSPVEFLASLAKKLDAKTIMKITQIMGSCLHADDTVLGSAKQEMWWPSHMADFPLVLRLFLEAQYLDFGKGLSELMS